MGPRKPSRRGRYCSQLHAVPDIAITREELRSLQGELAKLVERTADRSLAAEVLINAIEDLAGDEWLADSGIAWPAAVGPFQFDPNYPVRPELSRIRALYGTNSGGSIFLRIAAERGFFQRYGLEIEEGYAQTVTGIEALSSGAADLDFSSGADAIQEIAQGLPVKVIASFYKTNPYAIVGLPSIRDPHDLRGKTVAIAKRGDTSEVSLRLGLNPYGLRVDHDVQLVEVGNSPARLAALIHGEVAAAIVEQGAYIVPAVGEGLRVIVNLAEARLPYLAGGLIVTSEFARACPSTVLACLRGLIEGIRFFSDSSHYQECLAILAQHLGLAETDPQVARTYHSLRARISSDPFPEREEAETILRALQSADPSRFDAIDSDTVIDSSFMAALRSAGY